MHRNSFISFLQMVIFKADRRGEHGKHIHVSAPWPKPTVVVRTCHQPNMCQALSLSTTLSSTSNSVPQ